MDTSNLSCLINEMSTLGRIDYYFDIIVSIIHALLFYVFDLYRIIRLKLYNRTLTGCYSMIK